MTINELKIYYIELKLLINEYDLSSIESQINLVICTWVTHIKPRNFKPFKHFLWSDPEPHHCSKYYEKYIVSLKFYYCSEIKYMKVNINLTS